MSKKDYKKFAEMIKEHRAWLNSSEPIPQGCNPSCHAQEIRTIAESMASIFAEDNPLFDRDRFYKACGFQD